MKMTLPGPRALAFLSVLAISSAQGAITAVVSGGNGDPLTITFPTQMSYVVSPGVALENESFYFVFNGMGNYFIPGSNFSGSLSFTVNGLNPQTLNIIATGANSGDVTPDDVLITGPMFLPSLNSGDIVVLSSGFLTTSSGVNVAPTAQTTFDSFLANGNSVKISEFAVPEPGAAGLLALGGVAACFLRKKR